MLAGAGSVGKTVTLDAIIKLAAKKGITAAFHKSNTRKTYEEAGLTRESDALSNEKFNKVFQEKVMTNNCNELIKAVQKAKDEGVELFVCDRSPYDYVGYYFTVFQSSLTLDIINKKRIEALAVLDKLFEISGTIDQYFFPYPAHWSEDTESSDGWRADKTGKNFVWSSIVHSELLIGLNGKDVNTVDEKAAIVLDQIFSTS